MSASPAIWFYALKGAGTLAVAVVTAYGFAALYRLIRKRSRYYDMMRVALGSVELNILWYQLRTWIFGQHLDVMTGAEIAWYATAVGFTIATAHFASATIDHYEVRRATS